VVYDSVESMRTKRRREDKEAMSNLSLIIEVGG
jgi:hypothetical protein